MSRIGNRKLAIPTGVTVNVENDTVIVKGPKGELTLPLTNLVKVIVSETEVSTETANGSAKANVMVGTTNSLINNMMIGVSEGYEKGIEAIGVGYRFAVAGTKITISAGYSHPVIMECPTGVEVEQISNTEIKLKSIDKQKVTEFAANIRKVRKPEPYKGKGLRYKGEHVRRKEGKKAAK